jgi:hypothetical protein
MHVQAEVYVRAASVPPPGLSDRYNALYLATPQRASGQMTLITLPRNAAATADAAGTRDATGHLLAVAPLMPAWKADHIPDVG